MKEIKLTRAFFGPDNNLLKPGVHQVPEDWQIPTGTEVLSEEASAEEEPAEPSVPSAENKPAAKPAGK